MARHSFVKSRVTQNKLVIEISLPNLLAQVERMNRGFRKDNRREPEPLPQFAVLNGPAFLKFLLREMRAGSGGYGYSLEDMLGYALHDALSSDVAQQRGWVRETSVGVTKRT